VDSGPPLFRTFDCAGLETSIALLKYLETQDRAVQIGDADVRALPNESAV